MRLHICSAQRPWGQVLEESVCQIEVFDEDRWSKNPLLGYLERSCTAVKYLSSSSGLQSAAFVSNCMCHLLTGGCFMAALECLMHRARNRRITPDTEF